MIVDLADMLQRLRMTLPARWFGDIAPVLDGILSGFASGWLGLYRQLQFVLLQTRVSTATDEFLDLAAQDYLSDSLPRRPNESDVAYRARLLAGMKRSRVTRPAIIAAAAASGYTLAIFEPAQPIDTGAYNVPTGLAWNSVGGWGSMQMPFESLLVASSFGVSYEDELWQSIGVAAPAGGALWMRVST